MAKIDKVDVVVWLEMYYWDKMAAGYTDFQIQN